jgi:hypothetical protein
MPDVTDDCIDTVYGLLIRLRQACRDFYATLTSETRKRERTFAPAWLLQTLHGCIEATANSIGQERRSQLFVLTVLLYGALDWHFAGLGIDIEADVQLERIRQNHLHRGADADDRLSAEEWCERLQNQVLRLEQHVANTNEYGIRLVKLAALAQAALEAATRRLDRE